FLKAPARTDTYTLSLHDALPIYLYSQLGRAYEIRNDARAAQATYQTMVETARRMHDVEMECVALNRQAVLEGEDFFRLERAMALDRKSTRLNSSHLVISYAVFCL